VESRFDGYSERLEKTEIFDEITQKKWFEFFVGFAKILTFASQFRNE